MNHKLKLVSITVLSCFSLFIFDVLVSFSIGNFGYMPSENKLINYFSYGASTERKLRFLVAGNNVDAASITHAGWNNELPQPESAKKDDCTKKITVYGMSFSNRIAEKMMEQNECLSIRMVAGPGAPLSHSYAMFEKHFDSNDSDIHIMAILASALPKNMTMAHFNSAFEYPGAHVYPRYIVRDNTLSSVSLAVDDLNEFRSTINDEAKLAQVQSLLREYDYYYNDYVFSYDWMDYSNTLKMFRRSYAQKQKREVIASLYHDGEFTNEGGLIEVSQALVARFVSKTREANKLPVVVLLNDRGYAESLDNIYQDYFARENVKFISSSNIIDSNNLSNFLSDGHFTAANDTLLAQALLDVVLH